jgi:hypothetical protein
MPLLIGSAIAASMLFGMALGQVNTGLQAFGVLLGALVVMTLQHE